MNIKFCSLILLCAASGAFAADSVPDVQRVVSATAVPGGCQVAPATLVYLDSQGVRHTVNYLVMGTCQGGV